MSQPCILGGAQTAWQRARPAEQTSCLQPRRQVRDRQNLVPSPIIVLSPHIAPTRWRSLQPCFLPCPPQQLVPQVVSCREYEPHLFLRSQPSGQKWINDHSTSPS